MRKRNHQKETFNQLIENLLLSGTNFTKTDPISNDDIIIESFNNITLMRQDINEKENKILYLSHRLEILLEVSELKLNDINNQITSNNITSSHKANNDCSRISSNQGIEEIKFLRKELKNKSTIINILLDNIFSNNKHSSSYKKLEDNYKNNVEINQFETPKSYSVKNSDKTQDNETIITQNRYEVLSGSDESDTNGCNNDNDKLSNKKDRHKHKSKTKTKKEMKRVVVLQWLLETTLLKKLKVGSYLPKMTNFLSDLFLVQRQMIWNRTLNPH